MPLTIENEIRRLFVDIMERQQQHLTRGGQSLEGITKVVSALL
jgi:hypothetical protein